MDKTSQTEDQLLVRECLEGSERAWKEFYSRFIGLMRVVAKKHGTLSPQDVEDVTQSAFLSLTSALHHYDFQQSLPRFVSVVTERVMIDQYRKGRAAKRDADVETLDRADSRDEIDPAFYEDLELQDGQMERAQLVSRLKAALESLDGRCRELITLRYLDELSFKEVADAKGVSENTVTVQTRRCLGALRSKFKEAPRRGSL